MSVEAMQATLAMMCGSRVVITEAELRTSWPRPSGTWRAFTSSPDTWRTTATVMARADCREKVWARLAVLLVMAGSSAGVE